MPRPSDRGGIRTPPGPARRSRDGPKTEFADIRSCGLHARVSSVRCAVMRTAYKCRAYPDPEQAAVFNRTFGCVRLVWNKTLAERHAAYHQRGEKTSYRQTDAALTAWKKTEDLAFLSEVSSVPLQQTLRHQHAAFANFFAGRAKYPRFKNRNARQTAHYTRSAFRMKNGELSMAKTATRCGSCGPSTDVDLAALNPTMVVISRERGRPLVCHVRHRHRRPRAHGGGRARHRRRSGDQGLRGHLRRGADRQPPASGAQGPQPRPLPAAHGPPPARAA